MKTSQPSFMIMIRIYNDFHFQYYETENQLYRFQLSNVSIIFIRAGVKITYILYTDMHFFDYFICSTHQIFRKIAGSFLFRLYPRGLCLLILPGVLHTFHLIYIFRNLSCWITGITVSQNLVRHNFKIFTTEWVIADLHGKVTKSTVNTFPK